MIAAHLEPKGLHRNAAPVWDRKRSAHYVANAVSGSLMLRDAILLAKGIAPPPLKTEPRHDPIMRQNDQAPKLCQLCGAPSKPFRGFVLHVQETVAAYFGIHPNSMLSADRRAKVSRPRQIAMYLAVDLSGKSVSEIGRRFRKDHTTVLHAIKAVEMRMLGDVETLLDVEVLRERLGG